MLGMDLAVEAVAVRPADMLDGPMDRAAATVPAVAMAQAVRTTAVPAAVMVLRDPVKLSVPFGDCTIVFTIALLLVRLTTLLTTAARGAAQAEVLVAVQAEVQAACPIRSVTAPLEATMEVARVDRLVTATPLLIPTVRRVVPLEDPRVALRVPTAAGPSIMTTRMSIQPSRKNTPPAAKPTLHRRLLQHRANRFPHRPLESSLRSRLHRDFRTCQALAHQVPRIRPALRSTIQLTG